MGRGLYRRLGLSPDPEDSGRKCMEKILLFQVNVFRQLADFVLQVFGNAEFVAAPGFYPGLQIAVVDEHPARCSRNDVIEHPEWHYRYPW